MGINVLVIVMLLTAVKDGCLMESTESLSVQKLSSSESRHENENASNRFSLCYIIANTLLFVLKDNVLQLLLYLFQL